MTDHEAPGPCIACGAPDTFHDDGCTLAPTTGGLLDAMAHVDRAAGASSEFAMCSDESFSPAEYSEICRRIETHEALRDALRRLHDATCSLLGSCGNEQQAEAEGVEADAATAEAYKALALLEP